MNQQISGIWHNEHGSELSLEVGPDGHIRGRFVNAVGFGTDETFPVSGFASGNLITFAVNFGKYGSLTSWVGHFVDGDSPMLQTLWQMTLEMPHPRDASDLWRAVWTGSNQFRPGPAPRDRQEGRRAPPMPLWMA